MILQKLYSYSSPRRSFIHRPWIQTARKSQSTSYVYRSSPWTHLAAGVAGGGLVVAAGYTWYHFSGIKSIVDSTKRARQYLVETAQSYRQKQTNQALTHLRNTAKSYAAPIPGAGILVDGVFDAIEPIVHAHAEEAASIVSAAYQEVRAVIQAQGGAKDAQTAVLVLDVVRRRIGDLQVVGGKAGGDALRPILEKFPNAQERLAGGLEELKSLASMGPAAAKVVSETQEQVKRMLSNNASKEGLDRAQDLIQQRAKELRDWISRRS